MKVAIDTSPLEKSSPHHVRGSGFYLKNLLDAFVDQKDLTISRFTDKKHIPTDCDLVHFPYFEPFFLTLPKMKHTTSVVTVHDLTPLVFPQEFPSGLKGKIKWLIQKSALQTMSAIITDSESSKRDIIKISGVQGEKIHVIPLAAATHFKKLSLSESKKKEIQQKYTLPEEFVLYVGDVTWNKNLPRLVRVLKETGLPCIMVGKALVDTNFDVSNPWNKDRAYVAKITSEEPNIRCVGFVPDDELVALYNLATVFVMPSLYEGFGLPVLEAMSCGTPVITTKEGSLPEIAGDVALYVDAYNEASIAEGIKKVFENKKLQKELSEKGLEQAKKFSWSKTASMTVDVYQKVITG